MRGSFGKIRRWGIAVEDSSGRIGLAFDETARRDGVVKHFAAVRVSSNVPPVSEAVHRDLYRESNPIKPGDVSWL